MFSLNRDPTGELEYPTKYGGVQAGVAPLQPAAESLGFSKVSAGAVPSLAELPQCPAPSDSSSLPGVTPAHPKDEGSCSLLLPPPSFAPRSDLDVLGVMLRAQLGPGPHAGRRG